MKITVNLKGARELEALLRAYPAKLEKEAEKILRSEARLLAREYGAATDPPDFAGDSVVKKFQERIGSEVGMVFPTRDQIARIYPLIEKLKPSLAKAWWNAVKSGETRRAADILRAAGLPNISPNVSQLMNARTGKRRRVSGQNLAVGLVRSSEQRKFARTQQGRVGLAKAGWHQAALAVGGRVRRGNKEAFPGYVRKVSRAVSGLGGAMVSPRRVIIWSNVRYADVALNPRRKAMAESRAEASLAASLQAAVQALTHQANKSKAS